MKSPIFQTLAAFFLAVSTLLFYAPAQAVVIYESLPGSPSNHISKHGVNGPVLADDFESLIGGLVSSVEWWGAPSLTGGADRWEITFHSDIVDPNDPTRHTPSTVFPTGVISQHMVTVSGTDTDGDGIYHYMASWSPKDMFVTSGVGYWFSVANASGDGWTWANGLAPTVGQEFYDAVVSTGVAPNGGPHFGPWDAISGNPDFAFRINVTPSPQTILLFGLGLFILGWIGKTRT